MKHKSRLRMLLAGLLSGAALLSIGTPLIPVSAADTDAFRVGNKTYSSLARAYQVVEDGGTIEMLRDYNGSSCEHVGLEADAVKQYTVRGNGHTYTSSATHALHFHNSNVTVDGMHYRVNGDNTSGPRVEHTAEVTLRNSTWEKTGGATQLWHTPVIVYGTLILEDGTVLTNNGSKAGTASGGIFLEGKKYVRNSGGNYTDVADGSIIPRVLVRGGATVSTVGALFIEKMPSDIRIESSRAVLISQTALREKNGNSSFSFIAGTIRVGNQSVCFAAQDGKTDGRLIGYSLTPGDDIGVHFYAAFGDGEQGEYRVEMVLPNGETVTKQLHEGIRNMGLDQFPYYRFSCGVSAAEMTREITVRLLRNGVIQDSAVVSVRSYADALLADAGQGDGVKELVRAMLYYGAQAQRWFGRNTEAPADAGLPEPDFAGVTVPEREAGAASGSETGIVYLGSSLLLKSKTSIRHYFRAADGIDLSTLSVTCNGDMAEIVPCADAGDCFYVEVTGIRASGLSERHTVILGGITVTYSAKSYIYEALRNEETPAELKQLLASMTLYADSAKKHTEERRMKHRILLVSDMHYTTDLSAEELRKLYPDSNASLAAGPLFGRTQKEKIDLISQAVEEEHGKAALDAVLVLGDLSIDDYDFRKLPVNYVERFRDECMKRFPCPSYAIAGNHDSYPEAEWKQMFGYGRQYSVRIGDRVFIMLDTFRDLPAKNASGAGYTPVDTDFLKEELAKYPTEKLFLCAHYIDTSKEQSSEFYDIVKNNDRILAIFQGHTHIAKLMQFAGKPLIDIGGYGYSGQEVNGKYTFGVFSERWAYGYEILEWSDDTTHFYHVKPALRYEAENGVFDVPRTVSGELTVTT